LDTPHDDNKQYTYKDYCTWDDDKRWELIEGTPYLMAPAPNQAHQSISMVLSRQFSNMLYGKHCKVFAAPFDVRLNSETTDDTIVQPDLIVVCDESKLNGTCCVGAPDLIVEILSPSTARYDRTLKFDLYLKHGVREYWIVDPDTKTVSVHVLKDGDYITRAFTDADAIPVHVLEGCKVNMNEVFEA